MRISIEQANMKQAMRHRLREQSKVLMREAEDAAFVEAKRLGHADVRVPQMDKLDRVECEVVLDTVKSRLAREGSL